MTQDTVPTVHDGEGSPGNKAGGPSSAPRLPRPRSRPCLTPPPLNAGAGQGHHTPPWVWHDLAILVPGSLLVVVVISLVNLWMGPDFSCGILYLFPVAVCAWWGGMQYGVALAVVGAVAWQLTDRFVTPIAPLTALLFNGVIRFGTLAFVVSLVSRLQGSFVQERRLARSDSLIGAANARTFYEATAIEVTRAHRASRPLTLAYFDVDKFKKLNDRFGHAVGDEVLRHVVKTIQTHTRPSDLLARLGGDEFALLLPDQGHEGIAVTLERLQQLLSMEMARHGWPVTLSVGAVTFPPSHWDVDQMIRQIDTLMYRAKRDGGARVQYAIAQSNPKHRDEPSWTERRNSVRLPCNRPARATRQGQKGDETLFATVVDVSAFGIRLCLAEQILPDTVLTVEPLSPEAKTLLVRVLYLVSDDKGWHHGCEIATRLSGADLCAWLGSIHDFEIKIPDGLVVESHPASDRLIAVESLLIADAETN